MTKKTKEEEFRELEVEAELGLLKQRFSDLQELFFKYQKVVHDNKLESEVGDTVISDEEYICLKGISSLKELVKNGTFVKADVEMFNILYNNLNIVRGIKTSNTKKEKAKSHAELLKIVKGEKNA